MFYFPVNGRWPDSATAAASTTGIISLILLVKWKLTCYNLLFSLGYFIGTARCLPTSYYKYTGTYEPCRHRRKSSWIVHTNVAFGTTRKCPVIKMSLIISWLVHIHRLLRTLERQSNHNCTGNYSTMHSIWDKIYSGTTEPGPHLVIVERLAVVVIVLPEVLYQITYIKQNQPESEC